MTKRNHRFEENNNKKPKLDDDIDALWGDDLDETILDVLASQVEDKVSLTQSNNSILPSYNIFKEPAKLFCSTQLSSSIRPSTSTYTPLGNKIDQNKELELLRRRYEEREGEVTILRNQLKEQKSNFSSEQQKLLTEWRNKVSVTEKRVLSVRSELEFKNLEIANLKQKLTDVVKGAVNLSSKFPDVTASTSCKEIKETRHQSKASNLVEAKEQKFCGNYMPVYPLHVILKESFFQCSKREKHFIDTKQIHSCRNSIPYLQNQKATARIVVERSKLDIDIILPSVLHLVKCSREELDLDETNIHINKVICTGLQCLINLRDLLDEIKNSLRTEDILEVDTDYLRNRHYFSETSKLPSPNEEIGLKAGVMINLISELIENNTYLRNYLCDNKRMTIQEDPFFCKFQNSVKKQYGHDFLNKIVQIVKNAGEIRRVNIMTSFLSASLKLFINICKTSNYDLVKDIVCRFTKELILLRPPYQIVFQITHLFKVCSSYPLFVEFLLNKSKQNATNKKGVVYFNEDACRFYIYVLLFDNCINRVESLPMDVTLNMLCFIYNTCKSCYWLHHQNIKECDCLPQLYKLEMEIVFRALEKYIKDVKRTRYRTSEWDQFFQNKITVKILNLMMFHSDELTEKYITVFSQYKEIEQQLQEKNLGDINNFSIADDVVAIPRNIFDSIDF